MFFTNRAFSSLATIAVTLVSLGELSTAQLTLGANYTIQSAVNNHEYVQSNGLNRVPNLFAESNIDTIVRNFCEPWYVSDAGDGFTKIQSSSGGFTYLKRFIPEQNTDPWAGVVYESATRGTPWIVSQVTDKTYTISSYAGYEVFWSAHPDDDKMIYLERKADSGSQNWVFTEVKA